MARPLRELFFAASQRLFLVAGLGHKKGMRGGGAKDLSDLADKDFFRFPITQFNLFDV